LTVDLVHVAYAQLTIDATRARLVRHGLKWPFYIAIIGRMKVSVAEAKNTLPKLIKAVEDGESVTIYRHGTPVVDIVRTSKGDLKKPKFGTLKGKVTAHDSDWWKPMTDDEVEALLDGR
jgi:prevent-host-death family protein